MSKHPALDFAGTLAGALKARIIKSVVLNPQHGETLSGQLDAWLERGDSLDMWTEYPCPGDLMFCLRITAPAPDVDMFINIDVRVTFDRSLNTLPWIKGSNRASYTFEGSRDLPSLTLASTREMRIIGKLYDTAGLVADKLVECITKAAGAVKLNLSIK